MKKAIALLLCLVFAFSSLPTALALTFTDEAKWPASVSWAKDELYYMTEKEVLNGYEEDGTLRPGDPVTRAQFIKMLDETFGLVATTAINYTDVGSTIWYYPYIAKAKAQGYLLDYGVKLDPDGQLTREEAAALLARYLDLDPSKKVPASTYPDYNSISAKYRDYVLQVSYVGLFQGDETGNFSPSRILRRCEAAAILYRAAGTIYRSSTVGKDAGAGDENAVIAKSGITVSDAVIEGTVIVSEGAASGTVTITDCVIDTLEIRGTATVLLSGCFIDNIVVKSSNPSHKTEISILSGADIGNVTAETPVKINLGGNSSIDAITVDATAPNSSVSGSGSVGKMTVNATGFISTMMPTSYELGAGITAILSGSSFTGTGGGATAEESGFSRSPATYANANGCFMAATPSVSGTLYFYFTNSAAVPTATGFMSSYNSATVKSQFAVTAGVNVEKNVANATSIAAYSHLAIMISGRQPVVISNAASSGFVGAPTLTTSGTYAQLTFATVADGDVYYYFTNDATVPTTTTFGTTYNSSNTVYKGKLSATANKPEIQNTVLSASVTSFKYVVVLLLDKQQKQYQPVVITKDSIGTATGDIGCLITPVAEMKNGTVYLTMTPIANATVQYYFTNNATAPTSDLFDTRMAATDSALVGSFAVTGDVVNSLELTNQSAVRLYDYLVLRVISVAGDVYTPVSVTLPEAAAQDLTGTGFVTEPTTSINNGYYYINAKTASMGTLQYYLSNSEVVPTQTVFDMNYQISVTSTHVAVKNGGALTLAAGIQSLKTVITATNGSGFNYLVLRVKSGMQSLTPIVIPLVKVEESDTPTTNEGTGFYADPVYTKSSNEHHTISFMSRVNGTIWYYYTEDATIPTAEQVKSVVLTEMGNANPYAGMETIVANRSSSVSIEIARYLPQHVVLMIQDSAGVCYSPVVIESSESASSAAASGFTTTPTVIKSGNYAQLSYNAMSGGLLYYYFTNTASTPTSATFPTAYWNVAEGLKGSFSVTAGAGTKSILVPTGYNYLVIMLNSTSASTAVWQPVLLSLTGGTSTNPGVATGTGFSGTPGIMGTYLWFNATTTGTLAYYFTNEESAGYTGSASSPFSGTYAITQTGFQSVDLSASFGTMWSLITSMYKNLVVYIHNGTTVLQPVVVSLSGNGSSTGGSTTTPTGYGFSVTPTYVAAEKRVTFQVLSGSAVRFFATNAESQYGVANFNTAYTSAMSLGAAGSQGVIPSSVNNVYTFNFGSYKYLWIQLDSYAPYRVQIGG